MMEMVLNKGRNDGVKPLLLKLGLALVLSISGYFYSKFGNRVIPRIPGSPDREEDLGGKERFKEEEWDTMQSAPVCDEEEMPANPKKATDALPLGFSPAGGSSIDEEALLLPEFYDLIEKEMDVGCPPATDVRAMASPWVMDHEGAETRRRDDEMREMEEEIMSLQSMVQDLQDRERKLEAQLFEFYGLKEQDALVRELQNRLKVNTVETQLHTLKIEALQAENRRLEAQVSEYSKVVADLESSREMIKQLQKKMKFDAEQAKQQLSALHQSVTALHDQEHSTADNDSAIQKKLQMMKDLEDEVMDLRKANLALQGENSDLVSKLESTMLIASSLEDKKAQAMEEANHLREKNEDLEKEIERIQNDRCLEIEELVYLRWVNACLRYELRNYQPTPGNPVARDLSKALSPESEERVKQLILEYGDSGFREKGMELMDFDLDCCSSSLGSTITECDMDDAPLDVSSTMKNCSMNKTKFTEKLKRLVLGKGKSNNKVASVDKTPSSFATSRKSASVGSSSNTMEEASSCGHFVDARFDPSKKEADFLKETERVESRNHHRMERFSLDLQRLKKLSLEEIKERGGSCGEYAASNDFERMVLREGAVKELVHGNYLLDSDHANTSEMELKKYAQALRVSHSKPSSRRRPASFASF